MPVRLGIILFLLPFGSILGQKVCKNDFIVKEKNVQKIYKSLKSMPSACVVSPRDYLEFGKRAYLAGEFSASIWSLNKGIDVNKEKEISSTAEIYYYLGLAYLSRNRLEEAISTLRGVVFNKDIGRINPEILQKSHMALLQAYYQREKSHDKNVKFLMDLFKTRYKSSPYLYTIRDWNSGKYAGQ